MLLRDIARYNCGVRPRLPRVELMLMLRRNGHAVRAVVDKGGVRAQ